MQINEHPAVVALVLRTGLVFPSPASVFGEGRRPLPRICVSWLSEVPAPALASVRRGPARHAAHLLMQL